jgi:hypothetical protein
MPINYGSNDVSTNGLITANQVTVGLLNNDPGILNVYQNDGSDQPAQINLKNGVSADRLSLSVNDDSQESRITSTSDTLYITNSVNGGIVIDGNLTINNTPLSTSQLINIINGGNLYLWSNFR